MKLFIILFLIFPKVLFAFDKKALELSKEFLEKNFNVQSSNESVKQAKSDLEILDDRNRWTLTGEVNKEDDNQEQSPYAFFQFGTKTFDYTVGLQKQFDWGGTFSFSNRFTDQAPQTTRFPEAYGVTQTVSYSQDLGANLFGRNFYDDLKQGELNYELTQTLNKQEVQQQLSTFLSDLINLKLNETLKKLQEQAVKRASQRVSLIQKRVRDGLRERVDLYQSKMALLAQKEELKNADVEVNTSLKTLAQHLEREFDIKEVNTFSLLENLEPKKPIGSIEKNYSLGALKISNQLLLTSVKRAENDVFPTIRLAAQYATNDFSFQEGEVYREGILGNDSDSIAFSLNVSMPLGFSQEKSRVDKARSELRVKQAELKYVRNQTERLEERILFHIDNIKKNIASARERIKLAEMALKDYNKLYNRGRADLDQVIRAEEDLINTQRSLARYISSQSNLYLSLASLYGTLGSYIYTYE